jgi:hypothetical protein
VVVHDVVLVVDGIACKESTKHQLFLEDKGFKTMGTFV